MEAQVVHTWPEWGAALRAGWTFGAAFDVQHGPYIVAERLTYAEAVALVARLNTAE